jgi:ABC-type microcin C transport system permease subunit YejB
MASKDKLFGFIILILGVFLMGLFLVWGPLDLIAENNDNWTSGIWDFFSWQWAIVLPVTIGIICIGLLAAWIGYSMITTPPPVPLEELEEELEAEEAATKLADEKK